MNFFPKKKLLSRLPFESRKIILTIFNWFLENCSSYSWKYYKKLYLTKQLTCSSPSNRSVLPTTWTGWLNWGHFFHDNCILLFLRTVLRLKLWHPDEGHFADADLFWLRWIIIILTACVHLMWKVYIQLSISFWEVQGKKRKMIYEMIYCIMR